MRVAVLGGGPGGLYLALLLRRAAPDADVTVFERNRPDDTYGFGVVFYRLDQLLPMMRRDLDLSPALLRRKKYINTGLLILDEVGFEPMTRQDATLFFRLVSHRYQKAAILITTNKGIEAWPEILAGDEVLATAILDRLLHHSHVFNIKGRSYRLRDLESALAAAH